MKANETPPACGKHHSLFEDALVLFDLLPGELRELGVRVEDAQHLLHLLAGVQIVVDLAAAVQDGAQLAVGRHGDLNWVAQRSHRVSKGKGQG